MSVQLTSAQVWAAIEKELFAVLGMVTAKHESRTVGIVYVVRDRRLYIGTGTETWKTRHITQNPHVSMTIPIHKSIPFYKNKRLELVKSPKFFFVDNGFRNMSIKNFLPASNRTDIGALNENYIATELVKKGYSIRYWRTKSKAEVDFIIEDQGDVIPLEVKTTLNKPSVSRSFRSFLEKYQPSRGIITSQQLYDAISVNDIPFSVVPHWYLDLRGT